MPQQKKWKVNKITFLRLLLTCFPVFCTLCFTFSLCYIIVYFKWMVFVHLNKRCYVTRYKLIYLYLAYAAAALFLIKAFLVDLSLEHAVEDAANQWSNSCQRLRLLRFLHLLTSSSLASGHPSPNHNHTISSTGFFFTGHTVLVGRQEGYLPQLKLTHSSYQNCVLYPFFSPHGRP